MNNSYSDEIMERINARLGAGHRVKPYDLTSAKDLRDALLVTVAAYQDYRYYRNFLIELTDNYDESLEYCDTATWLDMAHAPERPDDLTVAGFSALYAATDVFDKLTGRAKANCAMIVKAILAAPSAAQKLVFGRAYEMDPRDMDARIEELFEALDEAEYHHSMPDNLKAFLEVMEGQWGAIA